jgi:hypothetical protein|tara:strand:+ start:2243 stop:2647 length:405 start_codon:yes stop_codon:yes gene_type:complete
MNGNTYGQLLLSCLSFTSISGMTYLIYEDTKRQHKNDLKQNEETINDTQSIQGSTYVSPYLRSYGPTDVTPMKTNQRAIPNVNGYYDNNSIIMTNLKDNDYRDNKGDLVSFTKNIKNKNFVYEDRYDKFLNYFE